MKHTPEDLFEEQQVKQARLAGTPMEKALELASWNAQREAKKQLKLRKKLARRVK